MPFSISALALIASLAWADNQRMTAEGLRNAQLSRESQLTIIDVRSPSDFARGHIQGAQNVPAAALDTAQPPKDGKIVLYCGDNSCSLGAAAADELTKLGYKNISLLDGGFNEWLKRKYPSQTGTQKPKSKPGWLSADEARKKILAGSALVLDLRPPLEFSAGHLPGARNITSRCPGR